MLTQVLTAPIGLPLAGLKFILEQIVQMAERELFDVDRIREELLLLQLRLEEGELTEAEFGEREAEIMARLRQARELAGHGAIRFTPGVVHREAEAGEEPGT